MTHAVATRWLVALSLILSLLATLVTTSPAVAAPDDPDTPGPTWQLNTYPPTINDNVILKWDEELLQTIRANPAGTGPTITARAIGVLHTATFDAWAAYDAKANGTRLGSTLRRPTSERTTANKNKAISFAAYTTLVDLFPNRQSDYAAQMAELSYALNDSSTAANVGRTAAQAVIAFRHDDGSNQLNGYADTSGYQPYNTWDQLRDPWRWQPLCVPIPAQGQPCNGAVQKPLTPHWRDITPFALLQPLQYKVTGPAKNADGSYATSDVERSLADTSNLTDANKVKAEYWADGPNSEFPPGHWALFAQVVSRKRGHSVDTDAQMFFALGNALLDASIAAWETKYLYDFVRPTTAIRNHYEGQQITSWLGPYQGYGKVDAARWQPYQAPNVVTPPFPEYVSGHSTFSAAASKVLQSFTRSDAFGANVTIKAGTSLFEPRTATRAGTPANDVTLSWSTFTAAADEAGWSRRWGGIHFKAGDEHGRMLGKLVGGNAYSKAQMYIRGLIGG